MIQVDHLGREFQYYKKKTGVKGSLSNLFHREILVKQAVQDVSFRVADGEILGLLGPNGAGKTTTLKMLSGILYPTSGTAQINGFIPWERKDDFKRQIAVLLGNKSQLWLDLPAIDTPAFRNVQCYSSSTSSSKAPFVGRTHENGDYRLAAS